MKTESLANISEIIKTGKTPPSQELKYFGGDINWYTPGDIQNIKTLGSSVRTITNLAVEDNKATIYPSNSLLITCIGDIGRIGIIKDEASSNQQITAIKPKKEIIVDYLYYWFYANKEILNNKANNAVVPILNNKSLKEIKINYPPLEEQKRIAKILDDAQALKQKTEKLIQEYNSLAQSIFLDMFGDPVTNPKGWEKNPLKKLTSKIGSGSTPKGGKEAYFDKGISLVRSLNIHDNFFKYKDLAFISYDQALKLKNVTLQQNDVLINITGASVARCTIVPKEILPARVNQHVAILRTKQELLNPIYLLHLLISNNTKKDLLRVGSQGGATREAITKDQLENFLIPKPPLELQNQFAEKIALIEKQKELAQKELSETESLFDCLLQRAFNGELLK
jgi:type I restriction enzyme S subunit